MAGAWTAVGQDMDLPSSRTPQKYETVSEGRHKPLLRAEEEFGLWQSEEERLLCGDD